MRRTLAGVVALVALMSLGVRGVDRAIFEAIRAGDGAALQRMLASGADANLRDDTGATPLMYAAEYGSAADLRLLLDRGAEPNAANQYGATALMWAAGDTDKVRLLVEHHAAITAKAVDRTTPLLAAARHGNWTAMQTLIEHGANPAAASSDENNLLRVAYGTDAPDVRRVLTWAGLALKNPAQFDTPVLAPNFRDVLLLSQMLRAGASANQMVPVVSIELPTLALVASGGAVDSAKILLDNGANPDARGSHGWTPLMMAAAATRPDPATVALLVAKGADPNAQDDSGRTALDWALLQGETPTAQILRKAGGRALAPAFVAPSPVQTPRATRDAISAALAQLQPASPGFYDHTKCVSCHHQSLPQSALAFARDKGIAVDEDLGTHPTTATLTTWKGAREQYLLGNPAGGGFVAQASYGLSAMADEGVPPDAATDAVVLLLMELQRPNGSWDIPVGNAGGGLRPPIGGAMTFTALAIRSVLAYAPPARKGEAAQRIGRAMQFLRAQTPADTQDEAHKLIGFVWGGASVTEVAHQRKRLAALQRTDGGWAQLPTLGSDAYATGLALHALYTSGTASGTQQYQDGAAYLLRTQLDDGTWHVRSRGFGFQAYFETGFPHGRDQFISSAATAYAVMALAHSL